MIPHLYQRDFGERAQPGVRFRVNSMRWAAIGGCVEASISAFGPAGRLWEAIEWLRCPVEIEVQGLAPWSGFICEPRVREKSMEVGVTIDSMQNAVAVAYSYVQPGTTTVGKRKTTAWATDAASIAEYGRKDFLSSQGGLSDAAATARRDAILASRRYPQGVANPFAMAPRGAVGYSGAENSQSATLLCRGWFSTLDWRMASVAATTNVASTTQIASLVTTYGQFLTGTDVDAASGISLSSYRDGDTSALAEILALLASGGAGGRRLLAKVDRARRLQVWEEPAPTTVNYYLNKDGSVAQKNGTPVKPWNPPVGCWIRLRDVIPATVDTTKMIDPTLQFIEGATWSADNGLQLQFRGQPSIDDMFKVQR